MINFELKHMDEAEPCGSGDNLHMSWFWLTDGDLWLECGNSILYEYSKEALSQFENKNSAYNEYPIIRFIEDFTELFNVIGESLPDDIYQLTKTLPRFLCHSLEWLDIYDTDEENDFYFDEYDNLVSWTYKRSFDSGHLKGGPKFWFFRNKETIRIIWETEFQLENGIELWTAKNGNVEISFAEFIQKVEDFGKKFFARMKDQVELAKTKDWKNIQIDKKRLEAEHQERESDFWEQFSLLKNSMYKSNWEEINKSVCRMNKELKTS